MLSVKTDKSDRSVTQVMIRCKDSKFDIGGGERYDPVLFLIIISGCLAISKESVRQYLRNECF